LKASRDLPAISRSKSENAPAVSSRTVAQGAVHVLKIVPWYLRQLVNASVKMTSSMIFAGSICYFFVRNIAAAQSAVKG